LKNKIPFLSAGNIVFFYCAFAKLPGFLFYVIEFSIYLQICSTEDSMLMKQLFYEYSGKIIRYQRGRKIWERRGKRERERERQRGNSLFKEKGERGERGEREAREREAREEREKHKREFLFPVHIRRSHRQLRPLWQCEYTRTRNKAKVGKHWIVPYCEPFR